MQRLTQINMLRRVLGVDESRSFVIKAVGEAIARLDSLECRNATTDIHYDILAGEVPQAGPGDNMFVLMGYTNIGGITGTLFLRVTDLDTGLILRELSVTKAPGEYGHASLGIGLMPDHDWNLLVELGH